jgi:hypothetical protein
MIAPVPIGPVVRAFRQSGGAGYIGWRRKPSAKEIRIRTVANIARFRHVILVVVVGTFMRAPPHLLRSARSRAGRFR